MDVALWIVTGFLSATFVGTGIIKFTRPIEVLVERGTGFAEDLTPYQTRAIGLVLLMIGAVITHARRQELQPALVAAALLAMAGFVAWGRLAS